MKKYLFLIVLATTLVACGNGELEEVYDNYKVSESKDNKKDNTDFVIFNDRFQKGKEK